MHFSVHLALRRGAHVRAYVGHLVRVLCRGFGLGIGFGFGFGFGLGLGLG